jgi:hypothetical protein
MKVVSHYLPSASSKARSSTSSSVSVSESVLNHFEVQIPLRHHATHQNAFYSYLPSSLLKADCAMLCSTFLWKKRDCTNMHSYIGLFMADVTVTQWGHMLRVVMTPSSMRVVELRLCLWWGRIQTRACTGAQLWDTSSWSCRATSVSRSGSVWRSGTGG